MDVRPSHLRAPTPTSALVRRLSISAGLLVLSIAFVLFCAVQVREALHQASGLVPIGDSFIAVRSEDGQWTLHCHQDMSADEFLRLFDTPFSTQLHLRLARSASGFPFIRRTTTLDVQITPLNTNAILSGEAKSALLDKFTADSRTRSSMILAGVRAPQSLPYHKTRLDLWLTAMTILLAGLVPAIPYLAWKAFYSGRKLLKVRNDADRLRASLCTRCRYDLSAHFAAGLSTCPECGLSVTPPPRSASAVPGSAHPPPPPSPVGPQA